MKRWRSIVLAVVLGCLAAAGCSKKESVFVGKWVGSTGSFQFAADKTGSLSPAEVTGGLPASVPFTWNVEGGDEVRITLPNAGGKMTIGKLTEENVLIIEDDRFVRQP